MNRVGPNFAYSVALTGSKLGLLRVHFRKFKTQLWSLVIVRFSLLLISCERMDGI